MSTQTNILLYIPSKNELLKIQAGTGDALDRDDRKKGYIDYVLWNTFDIPDLGIDGELDLELKESGMVMLKNDVCTLETITDVMIEAYGDSTLPFIKMHEDSN